MQDLLDTIFENSFLTVLFLFGMAGGAVVTFATGFYILAEVMFWYQGRILFNV